MYIVVDVESDGPIPHKYSMVCFGAVIVDDKLDKTFYGKTKPVSELWVPDALVVSGFSREEHLKFDEPEKVMKNFEEWIFSNLKDEKDKPIFVSDNNGFDWSFINYYFHFYLGRNPFGWSSRRIGDLYCGLVKDSRAKWKHLRDTPHTHCPIADSTGNAEVLLKMRAMGLKIKF